jgi:hypothetical protein
MSDLLKARLTAIHEVLSTAEDMFTSKACQRALDELAEIAANCATNARVPFHKPTLEEVKLLAAKSGLPVTEAEKFWGHYESNGWMVGRVPMKSVGAALANWRLNWGERRYEGGGQAKPQVATESLMDRNTRLAQAKVRRIVE